MKVLIDLNNMRFLEKSNYEIIEGRIFDGYIVKEKDYKNYLKNGFEIDEKYGKCKKDFLDWCEDNNISLEPSAGVLTLKEYEYHNTIQMAKNMVIYDINLEDFYTAKNTNCIAGENVALIFASREHWGDVADLEFNPQLEEWNLDLIKSIKTGDEYNNTFEIYKNENEELFCYKSSVYIDEDPRLKRITDKELKELKDTIK